MPRGTRARHTFSLTFGFTHRDVVYWHSPILTVGGRGCPGDTVGPGDSQCWTRDPVWLSDFGSGMGADLGPYDAMAVDGVALTDAAERLLTRRVLAAGPSRRHRRQRRATGLHRQRRVRPTLRPFVGWEDTSMRTTLAVAVVALAPLRSTSRSTPQKGPAVIVRVLPQT
jgi:hypothetical protein